MKRIITICVAVFMAATLVAQTPNKMSYQAVVRDASNKLVTNQAVGMKISILKGSVSGTAVYVEIYNPNPSTNINGLVTVEIGGGVPLSGNITTIDWSAGPYFIKTETDPSGGTNYSITGVSQLLSVPYALHARSADNGITPAQANAIVANTAKNSYPLVDATKLAGIAPGAEKNIQADWNQTSTSADDYIKNKPTIPDNPILKIGQLYQGGVIFWLDATGQHGLIAARVDHITRIRWYNGSYRFTGSSGDGLYAGAMNTTTIVASQISDNQSGNFAAKVCANYAITSGGVTYGDWYLPSMYELHLLYLQRTLIGNFEEDAYWSSNEADDKSEWCWLQFFGDSGGIYKMQKNVENKVRAIRAF